MKLTWFHPGRSLPHHSSAGVAGSAASMVLAVMAWSDTSATIPAGPDQVAAGTKSYEVASEEDSPDEDAFWFCQVVGKPSAAGSISVTEEGGDIIAVVRHAKTGSELTVALAADQSLIVIRAGVPVASVIPAPAGSGLPPFTAGIQSLASDPAWQVFTTAMGDESLADSMDSGPGEPTADCIAACEQQWPMPPAGDPASTTVAVCFAQAGLDHCETLCRCEASSVPSACQAAAAARYLAAWMRCFDLDSEGH